MDGRSIHPSIHPYGWTTHPSIHPSIWMDDPSIRPHGWTTHSSIHIDGQAIHPSIWMDDPSIHPYEWMTHPSIHPSIYMDGRSIQPIWMDDPSIHPYGWPIHPSVPMDGRPIHQGCCPTDVPSRSRDHGYNLHGSWQAGCMAGKECCQPQGRGVSRSPRLA
jgi:hypothetical protein